MPSQLSLYNGALRLIKQRRLATLTDDVEARYHLDDEYNKSIRYCLEQGLWNFALRTTQLEQDTTNEPVFGYLYAFLQPDDFVRLNAISSNSYMNPTLEEYVVEGAYWLAQTNPLYVSYISDDPLYGYDLGRWPATFELGVEYELAYRVAPHLTAMSDGDLERLFKEKVHAIRDARSKDALEQPASRPPPGRLVRARQGSRYSASDGRPWWR